jgi:hypothetical protein
VHDASHCIVFMCVARECGNAHTPLAHDLQVDPHHRAGRLTCPRGLTNSGARSRSNPSHTRGGEPLIQCPAPFVRTPSIGRPTRSLRLTRWGVCGVCAEDYVVNSTFEAGSSLGRLATKSAPRALRHPQPIHAIAGVATRTSGSMSVVIQNAARNVLYTGAYVSRRTFASYPPPQATH